MHFEHMSAAEFRERLAKGEFDRPQTKTAGTKHVRKHSAQSVGGEMPVFRRGASYDAEEVLHRACFDWIFAHESRYPILKFTFHSPNGGRRGKSEAGRFKAMGVRKGVVDIINPFSTDHAPGLACELKAPNGKLTDDQKAFLEVARRDKYVTGVCYTIDEFLVCVHKYLGIGVQ